MALEMWLTFSLLPHPTLQARKIKKLCVHVEADHWEGAETYIYNLHSSNGCLYKHKPGLICNQHKSGFVFHSCKAIKPSNSFIKHQCSSPFSKLGVIMGTGHQHFSNVVMNWIRNYKHRAESQSLAKFENKICGTHADSSVYILIEIYNSKQEHSESADLHHGSTIPGLSKLTISTGIAFSLSISYLCRY